jgi:ribonuclease HI
MSLPKVELYSDWWARPNPWFWGYGIILKCNNVVKEFSGNKKDTTNNRMELTWIIEWLKKLKTKSEVNVYTDSKYTINGIENGWAKKWQENNWMRTKKDKAINSDLWEILLDLLEKHRVKFNWVKGHDWHEENERCDELATLEILKNTKTPLNSPLVRRDKATQKEKNSWNICRKCNNVLEKKKPKKKNTNNKSFYYLYYMHCNNCKTNYFVEEAKVFI